MGERDEELLKQAARAVNGGCWHPLTHKKPWNPLTDDGDALRLAVKLQIDVTQYDNHVVAWFDGGFIGTGRIEHDGDPYAATRRAIVRAAASIAPKDTHG